MKKFSLVGIFCGAAFGMASMVSTGASAEGYSETVVSTQAQGLQTVTVSLSDLDLSKSEGIETLHQRISRAARRVCGPSDYRQAGSFRLAAANKACYNDAVAEGMSQIDNVQMAAAGE
jgi:UrcA family protein